MFLFMNTFFGLLFIFIILLLTYFLVFSIFLQTIYKVIEAPRLCSQGKFWTIDLNYLYFNLKISSCHFSGQAVIQQYLKLCHVYLNDRHNKHIIFWYYALYFFGTPNTLSYIFRQKQFYTVNYNCINVLLCINYLIYLYVSF